MKNMKQRNYHALTQSPFFRLRSVHKLAEYLTCSNWHLNKNSFLFGQFYESNVKKDGKKPRPTQVPFGRLRSVHNRIENLFKRISPPTYLHSAYPGRSYVSNAAVHMHNREIYCVDIRNFFPETSFRRIERMFLKVFGTSHDVATVLAKILTHKGWLATGSPASAIIAFYAHKEMFDEIYFHTSKRNLKMSVLMDDITISGPHISHKTKCEIKSIIRKHDRFGHKEKHYTSGKAAEVTGVVIKNGRLYGPNRRHLKTIDAHKQFRASQTPEEENKSYQRLASRLGELGQIENRSKERLNRYKAVRRHKKRLRISKN